MSEDVLPPAHYMRESDQKLFATLGALSADMRTVKDFIKTAATKEEVGEVTEVLGKFMARDTEEHNAMRSSIEHFGHILVGDDDGSDGIVSRVQDLEAIPRYMRRLFWMLIGAVLGLPPYVAACIEVWSYLRAVH